MVTQSAMSQYKFLAKLDNIKIFYTALKAICLGDDATIVITSDGFKAIVEESKYVQASMYVTRPCFSEYQLMGDEDLTIRLNLSVFTDCMSIFANPDCCMKMMYKGASAPFVLVLEQHDADDLITEVSIKTKNGEEHLDYQIDEEDECYNSLIVRGADFYTLCNEIHKATEELEITISPKTPHFTIESIGQIHDEAKIQIAKSSNMFISYYCNKESKSRYKMSHIRHTFKALSIATKVALRTDHTGLLGLQIMVLSEGNSQIYIEFFITPLIDD